MNTLVRIAAGMLWIPGLLAGSAFAAPLTAGNGTCRVELPANWAAQTELHDSAVLQVADRSRDAYLIVLSEAKSDLPADIDYHEHSKITLASIEESVDNYKVVRGPTELKVGGRSAVQYEVEGLIGGLQITYIHTTVDGPKSFHQVLGWTPTARLTTNRANLSRIIESFRELKGLDEGGPARSSDGNFQITLPQGWRQVDDLNDNAELQVARRRDELYLIVLSEAKSDFEPTFTYHDHARITLGQIEEALEDAEVARGPVEVSVGGRKAVQYEIVGTTDDVDIAYIHTTIDGQKSFHQVLAWTSKDNIDAARATLTDVIKTFRELGAGAEPPPSAPATKPRSPFDKVIP